MQYRRLAYLFILPVFIISAAAPAPGESPEKSVRAARTDRGPVIDGRLDDPEWSLAVPVTDFTQFDPVEGAVPTESTEVRLLFDDRAIYVGVFCHDREPSGIVHQLIRRDRSTEADRFTVQIDSYHDHQTAFVFSTNVSGVQSDGVLSRDGVAYDTQWDAVWDVQTAELPGGWSAEFAIHCNALRFAVDSSGATAWGINFRRYISRKRETIEWVMIPRRDHVAVSRWGHVDGLRGIRPPLHLELLPYVSARADFRTAEGDQDRRSEQTLTGGLDVKYGMSGNFTLDGTVNPDFGQVEVDAAVLNLTVFETLFPEKRPFFTEGAQLFTFGTAVDETSLPLFFSRRIGKQPRGANAVTPPAGGSVVTNPLATTILGAAKLSGRTASGFSIGALAAATDEEVAVLEDSAGRRSELRTEPRGGYAVVRVKQDIAPTSWIGGILTHAARDGNLPALSGGVDWNLRLADDEYACDGFIAGARSSVNEGVRDGVAARIVVSRISSDHWFGTFAYGGAGRAFDPNDAGFFAQPRDHGGYAQLLYRENFAGSPLRRYHAALTPEVRWNWNGIRTHALLSGSVSGEFENFWTLTLTGAAEVPSFLDEQQGIIGLYRRPSSFEGSFSLQTDGRRSLVAGIAGGIGGDARGTERLSASLSLRVRPASWMELEPGVSGERVRDHRAAVVTGGGVVTRVDGQGVARSLFGDRDLDLLNIALRGIVTFTPRLSLQCYLQTLIARGRYDQTGFLTGEATFLAAPAEAGMHDFNLAAINANILLRWEYLPGSALFLVWTQSRYGDSGDYGTGFGGRLGEGFALPHEDVVMLKISTWLPW